jgi:zinc protease
MVRHVPWVAGLAATTLALLLLLPARGAVAEPRRPVRLDNGLEVVFTPLPGAARASLVLVLRVGERHDPDGASGLSHLTEHCFVTAAAGECPMRTFEELLARYPDGHNAQTAERHTIVGSVFPPERLEQELTDAAARLSRLQITSADLAREVPRVLLELENMFERMPGLAVVNRAREATLPTPAGGRRGGSPEQVKALTLEQVRGHASRHYTAGNCVLSLAGPFEEGDVTALVARHLGTLPRGEPPRDDPRPRSARPAIDVSPVPGLETAGPGFAALGFAAPAPSSAEYAPFLVLLARLFDARARPGPGPAPLVFAPLDDPSIALVTTALEPDETPEAAVARLRARVAAAVSAPYGPADALRAVNLYGFLLGMVEAPRAQAALNPYAAALGPAARHVLGVDAAALRKQLPQVRGMPLAELAARLFDPLASGAAVVVPKT